MTSRFRDNPNWGSIRKSVPGLGYSGLVTHVRLASYKPHDVSPGLVTLADLRSIYQVYVPSQPSKGGLGHRAWRMGNEAWVMRHGAWRMAHGEIYFSLLPITYYLFPIPYLGIRYCWAM